MQNIEAATLKIEKTAHYFRHNSPGVHIRQLWIVCHGYAQRADDFLMELEPLHRPDYLVLAPEGLHNFYRKGFQGDVVAHWMTKRNRIAEIEDFSGYLQQLFEKYRSQVPDNVQVNFLGFSQGCATVCRWMMARRPDFSNLVLWGGLPPDDLDYQRQRPYLSDKNLFLLYGSSDPFLNEQHFEKLHDLEEKHAIDFEEQRFEGGHEVPPQALMDFLKKMNPNIDV